jgi:Predicted permease
VDSFVVRRLGIGWNVAFWVIAALVVVFLLWLFNAVLLPFVVAIALGYLLDPLVGKLERAGMGRTAATSLILVGSLIVIVIALALFMPMLARQVSQFVQALPELVKKAQSLAAAFGDQVTHGWISHLLAKLGIGEDSFADIRNSASDYLNKGVSWTVAVINNVVSRGAALLDLLSLIVITPVVVFYMLIDWRKMVATIDNLVPPRDRKTVRAVARDIDRALAGFLRGQSLVCLFLAAWYGIGLSVIGLNFGLLIGITGGLLSFVPYVGSLLVLVLSILIAVVQGWPSWHLPAAALGVVLIGQFLEGNVLSPKLVGDKVGLHPVWIMFALLAFGSVWGFTGLIVAVPLASAIGVLLRFATQRYRESAIYTGQVASDPPVTAIARPPTPLPTPPGEQVPPQLA